jgi:uncharacterized membrane protein (DUF485 family)
MQLMAVYILFVIIGEFGSYLVGRTVEAISPTFGLPVFLACFFAVFGVAWVVAVRVTEPRKEHHKKHA